MSMRITPNIQPVLYPKGITGNVLLTSIFLTAGIGALISVPLTVRYSHKFYKLSYGSFVLCIVVGGGLGSILGGYAATSIALRILNLNNK